VIGIETGDPQRPSGRSITEPIDAIIRIIRDHHPGIQAIYLYGTYSTEDEWPGSDVDIALLFDPQRAKTIKPLMLSDMRVDLETALGRGVDLINLRRVPTVLQKEVIAADRCIHQADAYGVAEFEMLTLSYYQKLNEERAAIIEDGLATGRFIAS
jgi:predicted nucleotidyltransferase